MIKQDSSRDRSEMIKCHWEMSERNFHGRFGTMVVLQFPHDLKEACVEDLLPQLA